MTRYALIVHKALATVRPQFRLRLEDGIHGLPHWSRVWLHGRALARMLDVNPALLVWFSFLHDSQRRNDGHDPEHGARAADFALRLRREGVIAELDGREFGHLCEAMRRHSDGAVEGEPALCACWDADRLDLGRVGTIPDARYLCTEHARRPSTIERALQLSQGRTRPPG